VLSGTVGAVDSTPLATLLKSGFGAAAQPSMRCHS
jgi:hypothetical protein